MLNRVTKSVTKYPSGLQNKSKNIENKLKKGKTPYSTLYAYNRTLHIIFEESVFILNQLFMPS